MNMLERQAWWILAIGLLTTLAFAVACGAAYMMYGHFGMGVFGALGLYGLTGFVAFVGWRDKRSGKTVMDERDYRIEREATVAGYSIFWVVLVTAAMAPMVVYGTGATVTVPTGLFGMAMIVGMIVLWSARAAAIVYLYRKDRHA